MLLLKPGLLFSVVLATYLTAQTQDKIYFAANTNQGDVQDITPDIVKYSPGQKKSKSIYIDTKKVLLLFNDQGNFLLPSRMDFTREQSQRLINNFLHPGTAKNATDQIYTKEKKVIDGNIILEDKDFIYYSAEGAKTKLEKTKIVAVIYRDGHHIIYGPAADAAEILWNAQQQSLNAASLSENQKKGTTGNPSVVQEQTVMNTSNLPAETNRGTDSTKPLTFADVAPNITQQEFKEKATHKTKLFSAYLKILCNKQAEDGELDKAIEQAVTLFVSENAEVETASVTRDIVTKKKIRKYLEHVRLLRYDKIVLEWTRVQYASDIKLGPDGNYHGVVSFEQVFKGYRDGKIVYEDITRKDAQVILKTYEKNIEGNTKLSWDVLLSDIGVTSYE